MKSPNSRKAKESRKRANAPKAVKFDATEFVSTIGSGRSIKEYQANKVVFRQRDRAEAVFFILRGKIKLTVESEQGREGVIAILGAGDFFGEGCLAGQPLHMSTATTLTESEIGRIEKSKMIRTLHDQPTLSMMFMTFLLSRNIQFEADLVDQLFNSSERRLARLLLLLANFGKEGKLDPIVPNISQEVLAARVGTTRSRINFFMNKFRKLGLIEYNGGLKVHSALLDVIVRD
jgi:CRP-like cAMP-binding protein